VVGTRRTSLIVAPPSRRIRLGTVEDRVQEQLLVACLSMVALLSCRAVAPEQRQEQQLKDSFVRQIASTGIVRDLKRNGDTLSFSARHGNQIDAKWRVHIDSVAIDPHADGTTKDKKGLVKSSWFVDDEPIRPRGDQSDLPLAFLDNGIAQECWALWDGNRHEWSWK
jgi:hypothetical protein